MMSKFIFGKREVKKEAAKEAAFVNELAKNYLRRKAKELADSIADYDRNKV